MLLWSAIVPYSGCSPITITTPPTQQWYKTQEQTRNQTMIDADPREEPKRYALFSYSPSDGPDAQARAGELDTLDEVRRWVARFRQNSPFQNFRYEDRTTQETREV